MNQKLIVALAKLLNGVFALSRPNTSITMLRHANAVAAEDGNDASRRISDRGKKQCVACRENPDVVLDFDAVLISPLVRITDTLDAIGLRQSVTPLPQLTMIAGSDTHQVGVIDTAYEIIGNVGLAKIMEHGEVSRTMDEFAALALTAIFDCCRSHEHWRMFDSQFNILIVGHAWFLPIIAYYLVGLNEKARRHLLYKPMGECDTYRIATYGEEGLLTWSHRPCPAC